MLKALELVGFKSFADKTRFEFPRGITAIVGPNGSGKSNVVDAIKWVLGEQSVKSLRGKEMADCIFNGSGGRTPLNSAEATLVFDNSSRRLALDTPEVYVTRRVYRSGEGEYLINRQPCRLRDIRELFVGTGMATEAYSVIEQGKVDILLQSSPRDRREIFEEAAGISRFKLKKVECLRRLERVEQNLLRLSDIVDEVESRLRGVRMQAGKARRHKELADRLKLLRVQTATADWLRLGEQFDAQSAEMEGLRDSADQATALAERLEAQAVAAEVTLSDLLEQLRSSEAHLATVRERIASRESAVEHGRSRLADLRRQLDSRRRDFQALSTRAGDQAEELFQVSRSFGEAQKAEIACRQQATESREAASEALHRVELLRGAHSSEHRRYTDALRAVAHESTNADVCRQRVSESASQFEQAQSELAALTQRADETAAQTAAARARSCELEAEAQRLEVENSQSHQAWVHCRHEHAQTVYQAHELQVRRASTAERLGLLEEMESRLEGVTEGVKAALVNVSLGRGPWSCVRGIVAEVLRVPAETSVMVDLALGSLAQALIIDPAADRSVVLALAAECRQLPGRVEFVQVGDGQPADSGWRPPADARATPAALGCTTSDDDLAGLIPQLLADVWLTDSLQAAVELSSKATQRVLFVARTGEMISGRRLGCGAQADGTGLVSRRSEIIKLRHELDELSRRLTSAELEAGQAAAKLDQAERTAHATAGRAQVLHFDVARVCDELRRLDELFGTQNRRRQQLDEALAELAARRETCAAEFANALASCERAQGELEACELSTADRAAELADAEEDLKQLSIAATDSQVQLATSEERLRNLEARFQQLARYRQEHQAGVDSAGEALAQLELRQSENELEILQAEAQVADAYLAKEAELVQARQLTVQLDECRESRGGLLADAANARGRQRQLAEAQHRMELAMGEIRHQRSSLESRILEDYSLELGAVASQQAGSRESASGESLSGETLPGETLPCDASREEIDREIEDLRRKIHHLGTVNLDALSELEELEARFNALSAQHRDLTDAKESLERIITKINADSRRLFSQTLEIVRGHFQALFRKLFGGGHADLHIEEGCDILDGGIEIIARPPGKEPRNISLLSGGEKTLTCVALLFAIFQYRPSPFCVLDEVDASLDEANIERFCNVLKEFLAWTQFLFVTHSKKSMTCATTLYGVTMQESGVSKRVSVQFEDVSEGGNISDGHSDNAAQPAEDEHQAA